MCLRSIGISERRAIHAARRADAWYCASVNPSDPYVKPSCSIPTDCSFVFQWPACQAMSERWTSWMILPLRETTKWEDACARGFRSQRTDPQKLPSVTWTTISVDRLHRSVRRGEVAFAPQPDDRRACADRGVRGGDDERGNRDRRGQDDHPPETHRRPA